MDRDEMARVFTPLAEALGWRVGDDSVMAWMAEIPGADHWPFIGPDAIRAAEAEIARRGLLEQYAHRLADDMDAYLEPPAGESMGRSEWLDAGRLITAPPEARVRAMLEVLKG